jgi:hypothetical protein
MYMIITMAYIVMGLALTTMCIDLAGTEYIRKIHYVGQKMESAKGLVGGAVLRYGNELIGYYILIIVHLQGCTYGRELL